jgi:signal transduction histidine kinase
MDAIETPLYHAVVTGIALIAMFCVAFIYFMLRQQKIYHALYRSSLRSKTEGQEEERKRVAEELHDDIGSILTGVKFLLASITEPDLKYRKQLEDSNEGLDKAIKNIRLMAENLRPPFLTKNGLKASLDRYLAGFPDNFIDRVRIFNQGSGSIPAEDLIHIYRICQELLCNALKYTTNGVVIMIIRIEEKGMDVHYIDQGPGFNLKQTTGNGLNNIRSRVEMLGGKILMDSKPGTETKYLITIPFEKNEQNQCSDSRRS